ncbi:MAG: RsfS/YbeB/iojap family protein, partial [Candidatus Eisenbacteria sp.]|nr:RsfS/YbeB/iojap family protein [Candidatus Eisenbacteria bacterium]
DCVDVVVHVFDVATRDYYQLERLWGDARFQVFEDEPPGGDEHAREDERT